jgi:hypothetical protein
LTKVVGDKKRARHTDKDRLRMIEILIEKGMLEEAHSLQLTHDKQQRIRDEYESS